METTFERNGRKVKIRKYPYASRYYIININGVDEDTCVIGERAAINRAKEILSKTVSATKQLVSALRP